MFHVNKRTPRRSSKQTSAAASKIKNKLLNTSSSFFRVSLKNNNKALALALQEQKERHRLLEKEIVFLQKQVEALCFELATKKYKNRKLLLILKNLHSNTLQHLDMVADLFTDSDLPKLSEEASDDINKENLAARSFSPTDQSPPQLEIPEAFLFPLEKVPVGLPEKDNCVNVLDIQSTLQLAPDVCDKRSSGRTPSSQHRPAPQIEMSRPSSSLREEVERLSLKVSRSGFDMKSKLCAQNSLTPLSVSVHENPKQAPSDNVPTPSFSVVEPESETGSKQEKTLLLNASMDITLSNPVEIITVETKAKKPGPSGKPKAKKKKDQASGSKVAENPQPQSPTDPSNEVQNAPFGAELQTEHQITDSEVTAPQPPKTQAKSNTTSLIPKLSKSGAGSHQKKAKKKLKSIDTAKSKTEFGDTESPPDLDDYFTDPNVKLSEVRESPRLPPEEHSEEEARPKITCRRSRTKSRRMSMFTRNTFFVLPSRESEVRHSESEQIHDTVEDVQDKYGTFKEQRLPELEVAPPVPEHVANSVQRKEAETNSAGRHKPRCRGTFVISVARESASWSGAAPEEDVMEQDLVPSAGSSICEAGGAVVMQPSESSPHRQSDGDPVQTTPSSGKRPWLVTQDSGSPKRDSCCNENQEEVHSEQGCTLESEFQKPKKARREEMNPSSKKKKVQREECVDNFNKKKQKTKGSCKGLRPEEDVCFPADRNDASSFSAVDPERNEDQQDDLQTGDSNPGMKDDIFDYLFALRTEKSKFKMESNPKPKRTSKLHPATNRNLRETFVIQRRKTKDRVSPHSFRTSNVSDSFGQMVDSSEVAAHQTLGDLLTDEMPPWLAVDMSTADTEVGSLLATPRREMSSRAAAIEESAAVTAEASPAGRVLTTMTNTISTPDAAAGGRTRRRQGVVCYKEPTINSKMRRGDKFTDSNFLSSPVFKDSKKKRKQKKTGTSTKQQPIFVD